MIHLVAFSVIHNDGDFLSSMISEDSEQPITTDVIMRWVDKARILYYGQLKFVSVRILSFQRLSDSP